MTTIRIAGDGQNLFRQVLMNNWGGQSALTDVTIHEVVDLGLFSDACIP